MSLTILCVCLGNICRSPAAEAAIRDAAAVGGLDVTVDSAGTGPWHVGEPPHRQVRAAGKRVGLVVEGSGRQVTAAHDLVDYDVILAMDSSNLADLQRLAPTLSDRMHLFRTFDPDRSSDEVPDPYGRPDAAYDETVRIVRAAAAGVIAAIDAGRLP